MENEISEKELERRKENIAKFLKAKGEGIYYLFLGLIVLLSVYIRTRNIPNLKDITTNTWTLGPDLDPFLFLRWAKNIVENGSLMKIDLMRYVPLGFDTSAEMKLLSYLIAWFHKFLSFFSLSNDVTYSAIIFPVFFASITAIAFFLFSRKIFYKETIKTRNIIALISTFLFVLIPSLLPRTIAGIPEKESAAFFFMFMAFYFFLEAFTSEKMKNGLIFSILAGLMTGIMGLIWGGVTFIYVIIAGAMVFSFLIGKIEKRHFYYHAIWIFVSIFFAMPFSSRYSLMNVLVSFTSGVNILLFVIIGFHFFIFEKFKLENKIKLKKIPSQITSMLIVFVLITIVSSLFFGYDFMINQGKEVIRSTIKPLSTTRFGLTVAENRQPYFVSDWKSEFGPLLFNILAEITATIDQVLNTNMLNKLSSLKENVFLNIPILFWLFFVGSVAMFNKMISSMRKKERILLTSSYVVFLICLIFSKYSNLFYREGLEYKLQNLYFISFLIINIILIIYSFIKSISKKKAFLFSMIPISLIFSIIISYTKKIPLDGDGNLSLLMYFGGALFFIFSFAYFYLKRYKEESFDVFKEFNFSYILYFVILTMGIIGARGAVRLIMVLAAFVPISIAFLTVKVSNKALKEKEETAGISYKIISILIILLLVFSSWSYYKSDRYMAENFAPGAYQWQWQKAMSWVRENTPTTAVFGHWWDYGYWLQSIGERATVLDGGNAIVYWNYFMGRNVLTSTSERDAIEFLYAHNTTHLLIDSTEIGKYTAFSSIGSNEDYDRFSWINTFLVDNSQTQESKDETTYIYFGGFVADEDTIWYDNGKQILFPEKKAGIGAIIIQITNSKEIKQPTAIFVYNQQQYNIPLRYAYYNNELIDFNSGLEAGVFIFPQLNTINNQANINELGALLYLSKRTIKSNLAQLYLFNKQSEYFELVHSEDSLVIESIKQNNLGLNEFVYYQGFQGPIKIWKINYPSNIKVEEKYLETAYPNKELELAKSGKYGN